MTAIGIMGGTFDPIHYGHLRAAEEVLQGFGLRRVVFVPSGRPPHKSPAEVTSAEHRYMMAELATADNPNFEVSRIEIDREGPSYTIDTLREFRSALGSDTKIYFITGLDAIVDVYTWNEFEHLFELAEFIAVSRPGYSVETLGTLEKVIGPERFSKIHHFPITLLAIASREIRQRVKEGRSIRYLVPESVRLYVEKGGLYTESTSKKFWLPGCLD
ncbi:MAG TPA: nicotinate-nucleotide adenylyltransferase [Bacillota bacterium]|nr:nicotinate-nucleotide adenylyltransferase [Bacillota bacterium]HRC53289.1 nicotinate-nucleotide adenylyltransferase [Bacillota bacterium]